MVAGWIGRRAALVMAVLMALLAAPALAQQETPLEPWQETISGQVEAFRSKDAEAAFGYAGAGFHVMFKDAQQFFDAIIGTGYSPIMDSRSHSFGEFRMLGEKAVIQEVRFVGTDQTLHRAYYELILEEGGWRVLAVQLAKQGGVGV